MPKQTKPDTQHVHYTPLQRLLLDLANSGAPRPTKRDTSLYASYRNAKKGTLTSYRSLNAELKSLRPDWFEPAHQPVREPKIKAVKPRPKAGGEPAAKPVISPTIPNIADRFPIVRPIEDPQVREALAQAARQALQQASTHQSVI
jgi:hypothetical protein